MKNLSIFFLALILVSCEDDKSRPNVVWIVVDDMNGYGVKDQYEPVKIPHIDNFRKEAVNFVNAACNTPVCNPSRSSFFSGIYPHRTGAYVNGSDGWNRSELLQEIKSVPEWFKANGYTTWGRGKIFHNPMDSAREYGMWDNRPIYKGGFGPFPEEEYWYSGRFFSIKPWTGPDTDFPDVKNADAAIEFLQQEHDKPFFLYYGLWRPHCPYTAPQRFFDMYSEEDIYFPEGIREGDLEDVPFLGRMLLDSLNKFRNKDEGFVDLWKKFIYAYCANTSFTDWNVGRVIGALDASPYAGNTIVIIHSDNGYHCGEKLRWEKATLWDQADYVPFLVRTPETAGGECRASVSLLDVFPTLVDYCGLEPPGHQLDGHSIIPLLKDPDMPWDHPSLTTYGVEYASVRNERYRYIRYPDGSEELYDHEVDPWEFNNIAAEPGMEAIKADLAGEIPTEWAESKGGRLEVPRDFNTVMRERTPWYDLKPNS